MALQANTTLPNGINLPQAYHRIAAINLDPVSGRAEIMVETYTDAAARQSGAPYVTFTHFVANDRSGKDAQGDPIQVTAYTTHFDASVLENQSVMASGYDFLKTVTTADGFGFGFSGAIDA